MEIKAINSHVVLEMEQKDTKTKSGILLTETAIDKPQIAKVLKVPKDSQVRVGDRVIFKEYSSTDVTIDNKTYVLVKEEDILATIGG